MASKSIAFAFFSAALAGGMMLADTVWAAPPSPPASNPALVYINRHFDIEVSNADGTAKTVLLPQGGLRRPSWAPGGACSASTPCHIVYEAPICQLAQFDLVLVAGVPTVQNNSPISTASADSACAAEISPIGNKLVFGEGHISTGLSSLWTMTVAAGRAVPNSDVSIYDAPAGSTITWSTYNNDGSRIAFVVAGPAPDYQSSIKIVDNDGTNETTVMPAGLSSPRFLEWSPDGHYLAYSAGSESSVEGVYIKDMTTPGSVPERLVSGSGASWTSDSKQVAFNATTGVSVIDIATRKITSLVKGAHHPKFRN